MPAGYTISYELLSQPGRSCEMGQRPTFCLTSLDSQYTTPEYIAKVIHVLQVRVLLGLPRDPADPIRDQGRITNIQDVPSLAPYFFVDPNYWTPEAEFMSKSISGDDYCGYTHPPSPSIELTHLRILASLFSFALRSRPRGHHLPPRGRARHAQRFRSLVSPPCCLRCDRPQAKTLHDGASARFDRDEGLSLFSHLLTPFLTLLLLLCHRVVRPSLKRSMYSG